MRLLVAPQEFKGTLTAREAAEAIARGVLAQRPEWTVEVAPLADGGPGTLEALASGGGFRLVEREVEDPLGRRVRARFGIGPGGRAVVEMAQASGLWRVGPDERDPLRSSTFGTGELVRAALDEGATRVDLGAGGSATCDGGAGALAALGVRLEADDGTELGRGGAALERLARIERLGLDPRLRVAQVRVLVDVQNPLLGASGAARVYGPQKGATPEAVEQLERALANFARVVGATVGRDVADIPGAGAAGGLAFGMVAMLGAEIVNGFDVVAGALGLEERIAGCDVVLTGEGRLDAQTGFGKGPAALAGLARRAGRAVCCFAGQVAASGAAALFDEVILAPGDGRAAAALEEAAGAWARGWTGASR